MLKCRLSINSQATRYLEGLNSFSIQLIFAHPETPPIPAELGAVTSITVLLFFLLYRLLDESPEAGILLGYY